MKRLLTSVLCALLLYGTAAALDKERLERLIQSPVKSLSSSPVPGVFEVVTGDNRIVYVDKTGRYLFVGSLLDIEARLNLTQERMDEVTAVDFSSLPLEDAIVSGSGVVRLAIFDDPDCPFCRKLHGELKQLRDVTLYYFVFNLPSHASAYEKAVKITCASNPVEALDRAMEGDNLDGLRLCSPDKVNRNKALADRIGIHGTPYIVPESGRPIRGFRKAQELQMLVDDILLKRESREAMSPITVEPIGTDNASADRPSVSSPSTP